MPVLPVRKLRKYKSLPTDSPGSVAESPRPVLTHSYSAPASGNKLVSAFLNIRHKWSSDEKHDLDRGPDFGDNVDSPRSESNRMMHSPSPRRGSPSEDAERPHLSPYFAQKKKLEVTNSNEDKRLDSSREEYGKCAFKRPTLNPFFNANHHFIKALRKMGNRDNFTRLKPGRDD